MCVSHNVRHPIVQILLGTACLSHNVRHQTVQILLGTARLFHNVRHPTAHILLGTSQKQHTPRNIAENLRSCHTISTPPPHSIFPVTVSNKSVFISSSYLSRFIQILPPTDFVPRLLRQTINSIQQSFSRPQRSFSWPPPLCKTEAPSPRSQTPAYYRVPFWTADTPHVTSRVS